MELIVNGHKTYCYSGGKPFDAAQPNVVFIHGVLHDHSAWILQSRYLANLPASRKRRTSSPRCSMPPICRAPRWSAIAGAR